MSVHQPESISPIWTTTAKLGAVGGLGVSAALAGVAIGEPEMMQEILSNSPIGGLDHAGAVQATNVIKGGALGGGLGAAFVGTSSLGALSVASKASEIRGLNKAQAAEAKRDAAAGRAYLPQPSSLHDPDKQSGSASILMSKLGGAAMLLTGGVMALFGLGGGEGLLLSLGGGAAMAATGYAFIKSAGVAEDSRDYARSPAARAEKEGILQEHTRLHAAHVAEQSALMAAEVDQMRRQPPRVSFTERLDQARMERAQQTLPRS